VILTGFRVAHDLPRKRLLWECKCNRGLATGLFRTTTLVNFLFLQNRNRMLTVCVGRKQQLFTRGVYDFTNVRIA